MGPVELIVLFVIFLVIAVGVVRWGLRTKRYSALVAVGLVGLVFVILAHRSYKLWKVDNLDYQVSKFWIPKIVASNPPIKRGKSTLEPPDPVWLGTRMRREQFDTPSGAQITLTVYYHSTVFDTRAEKADVTFGDKTVEIPAESIEVENPLKLKTYFPAAFEKGNP